MSITRPLSSALFLFTLLTCHALLANQALISDDGREVLIKDDGSWEFRSEDRFANTKDGRRIKLKADGSWVYVGNAPLKTKEQVRTTLVDIRLQKTEFETHKQKVFNNVRTKSQTVFYVDVDLSPLAKQNLDISNPDLSSIRVSDDKGQDYPVLSVKPDTTSITPDTQQTFVIRAKDIPHAWDGIKVIEIEIGPGILGNAEPILFSQKYHDIEKKNVKGFD